MTDDVEPTALFVKEDVPMEDANVNPIPPRTGNIGSDGGNTSDKYRGSNILGGKKGGGARSNAGNRWNEDNNNEKDNQGETHPSRRGNRSGNDNNQGKK